MQTRVCLVRIFPITLLLLAVAATRLPASTTRRHRHRRQAVRRFRAGVLDRRTEPPVNLQGVVKQRQPIGCERGSRSRWVSVQSSSLRRLNMPLESGAVSVGS